MLRLFYWRLWWCTVFYFIAHNNNNCPAVDKENGLPSREKLKDNFFYSEVQLHFFFLLGHKGHYISPSFFSAADQFFCHFVNFRSPSCMAIS